MKDERALKNETAPQYNALIDLTKLGNGKSAKVVKVCGGQQAIGKLEAMGIVPGVTIVKKYASIVKGPVVLEKDSMQLAIGYGIAQKILVEPVNH